MSRANGIAAGLLAGVVAAVAMTAMMLLLACFGVATPLVIIGDRLSVFIPPGPFLSVMGKVGGYNHLKELGVGSTIAGHDDLHDLDLCYPADHCVRCRALAGSGHKLCRSAH